MPNLYILYEPIPFADMVVGYNHPESYLIQSIGVLMQRRTFIAVLMTLSSSSVLFGCQKNEEPPAKPTGTQAKTNKVATEASPVVKPHDANILKIGMDADFAPFEFNDPKTQKLAGFDVDVAEAIAKQLNKVPEIVEIPFVSLVAALDSGQVDMVISSMAITEDRKGAVSFSRPYYRSSLGLIVNEDNSSIKSVDDLRGKKVGARHGSTSANKVSQITDAKVVLYDSITDMFQELQENKIDAAINDLPVGAFFIIQGGKAKLVGDSFNSEDYGIAVKKNNLKLLSEINRALDAIERNGTFTAITEKWFGK